MSITIPIEYGTYYHIYNRGINGAMIFSLENDYNHFLKLYIKYILPIADTFAWAQLSNHFHLLVKIKTEEEIGFFAPFSKSNELEKWKIISHEEVKRLSLSTKGMKKPNPSRQFSHLFNAYAKYFNISHQRTGSLFEKNFERILIESETYLKHMVYYIHHNPIHHGIVNNYSDYQWTSYNDIINDIDTFVQKEEVISWFDDVNNFIFFHEQEHDLYILREYLID